VARPAPPSRADGFGPHGRASRPGCGAAAFVPDVRGACPVPGGKCLPSIRKSVVATTRPSGTASTAASSPIADQRSGAGRQPRRQRRDQAELPDPRPASVSLRCPGLDLYVDFLSALNAGDSRLSRRLPGVASGGFLLHRAAPESLPVLPALHRPDTASPAAPRDIDCRVHIPVQPRLRNSGHCQVRMYSGLGAVLSPGRAEHTRDVGSKRPIRMKLPPRTGRALYSSMCTNADHPASCTGLGQGGVRARPGNRQARPRSPGWPWPLSAGPTIPRSVI